ncbi:Fur family transcriptional regulator [Helicobacter pametensis]|uniref:Fur family transcriptional regulator n=1 Tax=Helicobacter pametensis TaxID=95149 RepID=UPI0004B7A840|nr:transcriptional repressor [Helicobacter pametensis]
MNFEEGLKQNGLKITPQRVAILKEIQRRGHATIEEIYEDILKEYPSISLATIYKNIISLCEADLVKEVKVSLQKQRYEINCGEHAHIVCTECGKLEDIEFGMESFYHNAMITRYIQPSFVSMTIYGKCNQCLKE